MYDIYQARADAERAQVLAQTLSPFTIEIRFAGGLTETQREAFTTAAQRWTSIIVGDLPSVQFGNETIDDVVILAQGVSIDGPGRILGQAGPTHVRPASAGASAFLPARGMMSFDTADLAEMESAGTLNDVITHEMGHVLGVGTLWEHKQLIQGGGTGNPVFVGRGAMQEYAVLRGDDEQRPVPVENTGGPGTRDGHWRESIFANELMSGFIRVAGNPVSRVTVASLEDLSYEIDREASETFTLPNLFDLAESGLLVAHEAPIDVGAVIPIIPFVLPDESMQ